MSRVLTAEMARNEGEKCQVTKRDGGIFAAARLAKRRTRLRVGEEEARWEIFAIVGSYE
jgi:hypothetical protein